MEIRYKKAFLISLVVSLSISALIGIFIFLLGSFGDLEGKILLTTLAIGGFSLTGLCSSILYERGRFVPVAMSGIIISILGFLLTTLSIWEIINLVDIWRQVLISIILSFCIAHSCLLLIIESDIRLVNISLAATIMSISIVSILIIMLILDATFYFGESYFRILGVFAILDVLGTIVTPILNKVYSLKNEA